mgnify:CR=1 FL=1
MGKTLGELAQIYAAYQARLQAQGWADRAGLGWLAVEALEERAPEVARDWPLLVVDGFDNFTSVQLAMLGVLAAAGVALGWLGNDYAVDVLTAALDDESAAVREAAQAALAKIETG